MVKMANLEARWSIVLKMLVWIYTGVILASWKGSNVLGDELPSCQPDDFHYEYTECDDQGGRWRVSVPHPDVCIGGSPNAPVRGQSCDFICEAGQYLAIDRDQECHPCEAGHFSLGGGLRFEDFVNLPNGFSVEFRNSPEDDYLEEMEIYSPNSNCTGWYVKDKLIQTNLTDCTDTFILKYTVNLVRPGSISFNYQCEDETLLFSFEAKNGQCKIADDYLYDEGVLSWTSEGRVGTYSYDLTAGVNVLYWSVFRFTSNPSAVPTVETLKNVVIQSIDITGVGFSSECTACRAGTFSHLSSSVCVPCPANTFSKEGASECTHCASDTSYSEPGAEECIKKKACTSNDFYQYNSPCDAQNQTQKLYKWIEPQVCRTDLPIAVSLPAQGQKEQCPPCNPGMEYANGICHFCPSNQFSDGALPCAPCAPSTAPQTGIVYKWWGELSEELNLTTKCIPKQGYRCPSNAAWIPAGDHINSGQWYGNSVPFVVLNLKIGGFKGREDMVGTERVKVAQFSMSFELDCSDDCSLFFFLRNGRGQIQLVKEWTGTMPRTRYELAINRTEPILFMVVFEKGSDMYSNSIAKIYVMNVTNTLVGGAQECKACPQGASQNGCIPCPDGLYMDETTTKCVPCPSEQVTSGSNPWGVQSCKRCTNGLTPNVEHTNCVTLCNFMSSAGHYFDFSPLAGVQSIKGTELFTPKGYKYFSEIKLSLCGGNGLYPQATCYSNATNKSSALSLDSGPREINASVCRATVLPPTSGQNFKPIHTAHISLGDMLVAVTSGLEEVYNVSFHKMEAGFHNEKEGQNDVHFVYVSDTVVPACLHGLKTIVVLRCDKTIGNTSLITLPPDCLTGTCDGCTYMLMWRSPYACPRCPSTNFSMLTEPCVDGQQKFYKQWPSYCYAEEEDTESGVFQQKSCSRFWQSDWPVWLKTIVLLVPIVLIAGVILLVVVCHCWIKNNKLQYKYMKLVDTQATRDDSELPAADSCALNEGDDDDEQFDAVQFKKKGRNLFGKLGDLTRRQDKSGFPEMMQLSESSRFNEDL